MIRRSVYIGLGGTGIKAIAHTKKMYEDVFGEGNIPPQIAFVAIDNDLGSLQDPSLATSMEENFVPLPIQLNPREQYAILKKKGMFNWMFPGNEKYIPTSFGIGAGQVRTSGRLLADLNTLNIQRCISSAMVQASSMMPSQEGYTIDRDSYVDVHIAMSFAGGTGSGSFINIAQLIKERFGSQIRIFGYGVLHGVFHAMDPEARATLRVRVNSYSAVLDLDYLQSATPSDPIAFDIAGMTKVITSPLFDNFYLIDNKNEAGECIQTGSALCESLGSYLFHLESEAGAPIREYHKGYDWKCGNYNWENKIGWVQRLGLCQVVYDGEKLADLYSLKAKLEVIRQLRTGEQEVGYMVEAWCKEVGIFDVLSFDDLGMIKTVSLDPEASYEETVSTIDKYLENYQDYPTHAPLLHLCKCIPSSLEGKVAAMINFCGVPSAQQFLDSLDDVCSKFQYEIERKERDMAAYIEEVRKTLDAKLSGYQQYLKKLFKLRTVKQEYLDDAASHARVLLKAKVDARRYEDVSKLLPGLKAEIDSAREMLLSLSDSLDVLEKEYTEKFINRQNARSHWHLMYELSFKEALNMTLAENEVFMTDFVLSLKKPLAAFTKEELAAALDTFASSLPRCEYYRSLLINDVIQNLSSEDYGKLKGAISRMVSPLLALNERGLLDPLVFRGPESKMTKMLTVFSYGTDLSEKNRLKEDPNLILRGGCHNNFVFTEAPEMRQKLVFLRCDSAVIPYCVEAFDESIKAEYMVFAIDPETARFNPHMDLQIYENMKRADFSLMPRGVPDAMFYWVCGHAEKYICYKDGKYMYWNPNIGSDGIWFEINTGDRRRAFDYFKMEVLPYLLDDYRRLVCSRLEERGIGCYVDLRAAGREGYMTGYPAPSRFEKNFIDEEWAYIEKKLMPALQSLQ